MSFLFKTLPKTVKTNEEYAHILKKGIKTSVFLIIIGMISAVIAISNEIFGFIENKSLMNGFYTGVGISIMVGGIISIWKTKSIIKDEQLLKKERLKVQDERNQMIAHKALQAATSIILMISYVAVFIVGFYSKIAFFCFWSVAVVFGLSYKGFKFYYNKKI